MALRAKIFGNNFPLLLPLLILLCHCRAYSLPPPPPPRRPARKHAFPSRARQIIHTFLLCRTRPLVRPIAAFVCNKYKDHPTILIYGDETSPCWTDVRRIHVANRCTVALWMLNQLEIISSGHDGALLHIDPRPEVTLHCTKSAYVCIMVDCVLWARMPCICIAL